jgi:hypothetical protein
MSQPLEVCDGKPSSQENPNSRMVLKHVSIVQSTWLAVDAASMCRYSVSEADRSLNYNPVSDKICRLAEAVYGCRAWPLGPVPIDIDDLCDLVEDKEGTSRAVYCTFAAALLQGHVLSELRALSRNLIGKPEVVLGPLGGRRSTELVTALAEARVRSRQKLVKIWSEPGRDQFLRNEYIAWVRDRDRRSAEGIWAQMVRTHVEASRNTRAEVEGGPFLKLADVSEDEDSC